MSNRWPEPLLEKIPKKEEGNDDEEEDDDDPAITAAALSSTITTSPSAVILRFGILGCVCLSVVQKSNVNGDWKLSGLSHAIL